MYFIVLYLTYICCTSHDMDRTSLIFFLLFSYNAYTNIINSCYIFLAKCLLTLSSSYVFCFYLDMRLLITGRMTQSVSLHVVSGQTLASKKEVPTGRTLVNSTATSECVHVSFPVARVFVNARKIMVRIY